MSAEDYTPFFSAAHSARFQQLRQSGYRDGVLQQPSDAIAHPLRPTGPRSSSDTAAHTAGGTSSSVRDVSMRKSTMPAWQLPWKMLQGGARPESEQERAASATQDRDAVQSDQPGRNPAADPALLGRHDALVLGPKWRHRAHLDHLPDDDRPPAPAPAASFQLSLAADRGYKTAQDSHSEREMAPKTHTWIALWFLLTTPIILYDAFFLFLRPRTFKGGDLHWFWWPYGIQQDLDLIYGLPAYESGDGFPNAQSALNLVETAINLSYVYLAHVAQSPSAPLVGFAGATATFWKTVLYWLQDAYCGWCSVGHNDWKTLILWWGVPNGLWIVVPAAIVYVLGRDIVRGLQVADAASAVAAGTARLAGKGRADSKKTR